MHLYRKMFPNHAWVKVDSPHLLALKILDLAGIPYERHGMYIEVPEWAWSALTMWKNNDDLAKNFDPVTFIEKMKPEYQGVSNG